MTMAIATTRTPVTIRPGSVTPSRTGVAPGWRIRQEWSEEEAQHHYEESVRTARAAHPELYAPDDQDDRGHDDGMGLG